MKCVGAYEYLGIYHVLQVYFWGGGLPRLCAGLFSFLSSAPRFCTDSLGRACSDVTRRAHGVVGRIKEA